MSFSRLLLTNCITVLIYFISGIVGLSSSIPPSNAAVIWPPAGAALAFTILFPRLAVIPGLILGAFSIEFYAFYILSSDTGLIVSILCSIGITIGALVQAMVGAIFFHSLQDKDACLIKEHSILLFFFLMIPLTCIISSVIGNLSLLLTGILPIRDLLVSLTIWWTGDYIAILILTPLLLCLLAKPREIWKQRLNIIAIPLIILLAVVLMVFKFSYDKELENIEVEFERNVNLFTNAFREGINSNSEAASQLQEFFNSSDSISKEEFENFTLPKIERHPWIQALEWIPVIEHRDRAEFENTISSPIRAFSDAQVLEIAPEKAVYFPVYYVIPLATNEVASGFDISSNNTAFNAAQSACDSGEIAVTNPIIFVQSQDAELGVVFYAPVYNPGVQNCQTLKGFVASLVKLEGEIRSIHQTLPDTYLAVNISNRENIFYSESSEDESFLPESFQLQRNISLPIADQVWDLSFYPSNGFLDFYSPWQLWIIIYSGFFIVSITSTGLMLLTGRTLQVEEIVTHRTNDLYDEINERKSISRLLSIENQCLEMIAQEFPMTSILDTVLTNIETMIPGSLTSILLLDDNRKSLFHCSAPSLPQGYIDDIDGASIGPEEGSCGTAAYLNKQVVVTDISTDPLWEHYRHLALAHGLKACFSTPICGANNEVLGTFAVYFTSTNVPEDKLMRLIDDLNKIVTVTILRKRSEEQLSHQASHDSLTGLINRDEFERQVEILLAKRKGSTAEHALCFMDLDQFKVINDTCGHAAGDEMLKQLALLLLDKVRNQDKLARLGGDEFGLLMPQCSLEKAHALVSFLQETINNHQFRWEDNIFNLGVSIGLVSMTTDENTLTSVMKEADAACYMAKDFGRNRVHIYNKNDENIVRRSGDIQWVSRIHRAFDENRFTLYVQPIVALDNTSGNHYEFLIRMIDEDGSLITPGFFLPAAESYNIISKLDYWVLDNFFTILIGNPSLLNSNSEFSINLSGPSLNSPDILSFIETSLKNSAINPENICFEVTETAAIYNINAAVTFIDKIQKLGCKFALDDFGSGLSSFGYLKTLPVDYLKIDGMFVKDMANDPTDYAMVKSINDIGHVMGMKTIAEFVESEDIKNMLIEIGVDFAQGYWVGKPVPVTDILEE